MKVNRQRVPCVRNSSYSFIPIILKLYRCLHHTLKMCMWFGYNPQIKFWHFFCKLNLVVFRYFDNESEWTVGALCAQLLHQFLIQILLKLYRCLDDTLKICMCFGYNPQVNFWHFFRNLNLVVFQAFIQWKWMDIVCKLLPQFYCPPPFRRKAEGHSFWLSVLPSVRPSVPL